MQIKNEYNKYQTCHNKKQKIYETRNMHTMWYKKVRIYIKTSFRIWSKKKVQTWTDELAEELHKPVRHKFVKRRVEVRGINDIWAADLVDMQAFSRFNKGIKYLLMVIDIFTKYGWIVPLKTKTGMEVAEGLKSIFKNHKPRLLWVDKGTEFYNKHVKAIINIYSTENEEKSCVVERWNRTMKEKMFKYFSSNNTRKYIDILQNLVNQYNTTIHSSIKMTPVEASKRKK